MTSLLLVDDDESNRITLSALLENEGFHVDAVASLALARQALTERHVAYDLALLDLHLGDGFGSDLLPLLREGGTPIIAISGSLEALDSVEGIGARFAKGAGFEELLSLIRAQLSDDRHFCR